MTTTVDLNSPFVVFLFIATASHMVWNAWLNWRNRDFVLRTENETPTKLQKLHTRAKDIFTEDRLRKSLEYERTVSAFGMFETKAFQLLELGILAFGIIPWMLHVASDSFGLPIWLAVCVIPVLLYIVHCILSLPFNYHSTFALEERFGFNLASRKLFFSDFFKEIGIYSVLQLTVGIGVFFAFYALYRWHGSFDVWACLTLAVMSSTLAMVYELMYDKVILPMFNKMRPMDDGPLKTRMEDLLKKFGYNPAGVFVIDASKRSKHSNAYCAGWGKNKRLVLFDTLLKTFSDDEVLAVLGHELAHSKLNHLVIGRLTDFCKTFAYLFIASVFISKCVVQLLSGFGFDFVLVDIYRYWQASQSQPMALAVLTVLGFEFFGKLWDSVVWIFDGVWSWMSRKMEFAADEYSCRCTGNREAMVTALFKLYDDNLSYPVSDPVYETWNFSHPGLVNRVNALNHADQN